MFGFKKKAYTQSNINVEYLIVGLGNPGRRYESTRHNVGFLFLDYLSEQCGVKINRIKFKSTVADASINGARCLLQKPQTFMNKSGEAVREAADFYKIPPEKIIVIHDDIALPTGKLRIRVKGSDGGHNGIKSIIYLLNSDAFKRIKIGVGGKPHPDYNQADWVLSGFSAADRKLILDSFDRAGNAVELLVKEEIAKAMNMFN